jgi:2-keto-3-deoxy-L-rhamnonate aldolase RhmA
MHRVAPNLYRALTDIPITSSTEENSKWGMTSRSKSLRAAQGAGVAPMIRTFDRQPSTLVRALDIGCEGILVPNVKSLAEAERVALPLPWG